MKTKTRINRKTTFMLAVATLITVMICMSISVSAEEHTHTHTDWTAITDTLPTEAGNYYLTQDITLSSSWVVSDEITLCFNGNDIVLNDTAVQITVNSKAVLTLCNCSETESILEKTVEEKLISVDGTVNIYDVTIKSIGNALYTNYYSSLNIYSGNISSTGTTTDGSSSAINSMGTTNIYDGTITSCDSAVYNSHPLSVLNIENGQITSTGKYGIDFRYGSAYINGGTIKATSSNAIYAATSKTILEIGGNAYITTSYNSADTIYFCGTTFKLSGKAIIEHTNNCDVVYINSSSCTKVDIIGGTIKLKKVNTTSRKGLYIEAKNADVNISNCTIEIPSRSYKSVYAYSYKTLTLSGKVTLGGYFYLEKGIITITEEGFTTDSPILISTGATKPAAITTQNNKDYSGNFVSSNSSYKIYNDNNTVMIGNAVQMSGTLTIDGVAFVGKTLTATYIPGSDVETVSYQWYRDDVAISGATATTYTTTSDDSCKTIKVIVSGTGLCSGEQEASVYVTPGYPVNLDTNGGACETAVLYADESGKIAELPTPTRSGFTFNGWYDAKENGKKITTENAFTQETTIFAQWTLVTEHSVNILAPYDVSSTYDFDFYKMLPDDTVVSKLSVSNPAAAIVSKTSPLWSNTRAEMTLVTRAVDNPQSGSVIVAIYTTNYGTITITINVSVVDFEICSYDSTTNSADITFKEAGTYTVIFADYGDNNALENIETQEITITETGNVPVSITKGFTLGTGDKIMLWQDMINLVPMCEAYLVE